MKAKWTPSPLLTLIVVIVALSSWVGWVLIISIDKAPELPLRTIVDTTTVVEREGERKTYLQHFIPDPSEGWRHWPDTIDIIDLWADGDTLRTITLGVKR